MYTVKYRPTNLDNFIGNKNVIQPFIQWLLEWDPNNKKTKCGLVSGVNGIGKSLLVDLILKKHNYNIISLSIDDERDKETTSQIIKPLLKMKKTVNGQNNCLVVSDIDCGGGDYGFISILTECIKETQIPIICICDNRFDQNIKPILNYCFDIKLIKPNYAEIYRLINTVITTEKLKMNKSAIDDLYEESNGDIRFILNTLQLGLQKGNNNKNIQSLNIFDTTGKLLSLEPTFEEKYKYYWIAPDIHTLMIQENYINNTLTTKDDVKRFENISYSADSLSDVDMFDSVFDFELDPYIAINTIKSSSKCTKKGTIKFPQYLGRISTLNKNKRHKLYYDNIKFCEDTKPESKEKKPKAEPKEKKPKAEPKEKKPKAEPKEKKPKAEPKVELSI